MSGKHRVLIRKCDSYDNVERIRGIVREGIEQLGVKPRGKILLKPNLIFAHRRYGRHGYTNPAVVEAVIDVLSEQPDIEKVTIGERTGVTVPTRYTFNEAGYGRFLKKPLVEACFFDEAPLVEVNLRRGAFHQKLHFAKPLVESDFKVYLPKLKHHVSTKITIALKLNIGICDSKQRMPGHDFHLEEKIADLYEVGNPDFVVVDGIVMGQQNEVVPTPLDMGIIMMGTSGVAIDSVGARIMNFDPGEIKHLRIARERGWEPVTDDQIEIESEIPFEELQQRTKNLDRTFKDPRELDTPIRFYLGNYPGGNEFCTTGCGNMIKTCLAVMEAFSPGALKKANPVAVVIGEYDGDVDGQGHKILVVGDCTKINGEVRGKTVRIGGCPVVVPFFMIPACRHFGTPSPYSDASAFLTFPAAAARQQLNKFINRVLT